MELLTEGNRSSGTTTTQDNKGNMLLEQELTPGLLLYTSQHSQTTAQKLNKYKVKDTKKSNNQ